MVLLIEEGFDPVEEGGVVVFMLLGEGFYSPFVLTAFSRSARREAASNPMACCCTSLRNAARRSSMKQRASKVGASSSAYWL